MGAEELIFVIYNSEEFYKVQYSALIGKSIELLHKVPNYLLTNLAIESDRTTTYSNNKGNISITRLSDGQY